VSVAICLFALAVGWQQWTQRLNFGRRFSHIRANHGEIEAYIEQRDVQGQYLVIRRGESMRHLLLEGPNPRIFWIQEGKTIGVVSDDYRGLEHGRAVVDLDLLANADRLLTTDEIFRRRLTPDEEKLFKAEEGAVKQAVAQR